MSNPKVIIHLEGGLVQWVYSDTPMDVLIMDSDTDGADPDEIIKYHDMDGDEGEAVFHYDIPNANPKETKWVKSVMAEVDKAKEDTNE